VSRRVQAALAEHSGFVETSGEVELALAYFRVFALVELEGSNTPGGHGRYFNFVVEALNQYSSRAACIRAK
jgi:hypothetical protein